jgi:glycosyltransferase involved in cell wall biosynthesis
MPPFNELNELYNCLDLYIVSSRYEGGPQAIFECALTKTPIISTNVGVAPEVLSPNSIYDMSNFGSAKPDIDYAFSNAQKYIIPDGVENFIKMFNEVLGDQNEK